MDVQLFPTVGAHSGGASAPLSTSTTILTPLKPQILLMLFSREAPLPVSSQLQAAAQTTTTYQGFICLSLPPPHSPSMSIPTLKCMKFSTRPQIPCGIQYTPLHDEIVEFLPDFAAKFDHNSFHDTFIFIFILPELKFLALAVHISAPNINQMCNHMACCYH